MKNDYFDELICKAVANCERVTCIRCPMFSLTPLKNGNHCLISEIMKEAQRMKTEAETRSLEIEVSGTTFTHWDNETRRKHGLPLKEESEASE